MQEALIHKHNGVSFQEEPSRFEYQRDQDELLGTVKKAENSKGAIMKPTKGRITIFVAYALLSFSIDTCFSQETAARPVNSVKTPAN
ncbi:MAG: hypothetical protein GX946_11250 [Oligosphaeraceae bacterium]|nr:hypothetical protein [Oligosphaeraceae bacterium]